MVKFYIYLFLNDWASSMLAGLGMGIACLISVLEFCWKSGRVESKVNVKHRKYIILIFIYQRIVKFTKVPLKALSDQI